jgi:hypothetical protein
MSRATGIIAFVTIKGGSGKTTLCACLCAEGLGYEVGQRSIYPNCELLGSAPY